MSKEVKIEDKTIKFSGRKQGRYEQILEIIHGIPNFKIDPENPRGIDYIAEKRQLIRHKEPEHFSIEISDNHHNLKYRIEVAKIRIDSTRGLGLISPDNYFAAWIPILKIKKMYLVKFTKNSVTEYHIRVFI